MTPDTKVPPQQPIIHPRHKIDRICSPTQKKASDFEMSLVEEEEVRGWLGGEIYRQCGMDLRSCVGLSTFINCRADVGHEICT